ncbi:MAG: SOS response-associated peptidase family protein [Verrucomicrobiales bacterium]
MCNLFDIGPNQNKGRKRWEKQLREAVETLPKIYHIRRTDTAAVLRQSGSDGSSLEPAIMRWGFRRDFSDAINNTRSDKLAGGMWRDAFAHRRCAIPVAAFYEWTGARGDKQAYAFRERGGGWLWAAGVWEAPGSGGLPPAFSMVTTAAAPWMKAIHDRMPALLAEDQVEAYITGPEPAALIAPLREALEFFRCENPLLLKTPGPPVPDAQGDLFF